MNIYLILAFLGLNTIIYAQNADSWEVHYFGALKNIMHDGDLTAKFDLASLKDIKGIYALGAFENLKGEIQIFNGSCMNAIVASDSLLIDKTFDHSATLFVYAKVNKWKELKIPKSITTQDKLERYISRKAKKSGLNINQPFPFLIDGNISELEWHVINWKDGDMEHTHEKHINAGLKGKIMNENIEIIGFYSDSHHRIFTHHTTNVHMHFKSQNDKLAGHVDTIKLGRRMILKLPVNP
jgi:acetolactate decarboxylase